MDAYPPGGRELGKYCGERKMKNKVCNKNTSDLIECELLDVCGRN